MQSRSIRSSIYNLAYQGRTFSTQSGFVDAPYSYLGKRRLPASNSLLGPTNKQFPLPGDVGHHSLSKPPKIPTADKNMRSLRELIKPVQVKRDANYLKEIQEKRLEMVHRQSGFWPIELTAQETPRLLRKDLKHLFPDIGIDTMATIVLNLVQKSENDMAAWSKEMEDERESLTCLFISSATSICNALSDRGYWADFVDPASGRPYLGQYSNFTLCETDDVYKNMGFIIEDLGCCKVSDFLD